MKVIKYRLMTEVNHGTYKEPQIEQVFSDVELGWSEANEEVAKTEAYNGEYTIEDIPDEPAEPTQLDRIEEMLDTLLGVTE